MLAARFNVEDVVEFLVRRGASLELKELNHFRAIDIDAEQESKNKKRTAFNRA